MSFKAVDMWVPGFDYLPASLATSGVIDATGEKVAMIGPVYNKDRASKDITKVGIRFGAVTKAGGSGLTLSLQDVDATAGPPLTPDGTQDQTVAIAAADVTANTFLKTNALSASRTVAFGEMLAVVVEFDGGGRLGADSFVINTVAVSGTTVGLDTSSSLFTASWASLGQPPLVLFEFTDGTFGGLSGGMAISDLTAIGQFGQTSATDEYALRFQVPYICKVDGLWMLMRTVANTANFEAVLYNGTTALATVAHDANMTDSTSGNRVFRAHLSEVTLYPGNTYYVALKPVNAASTGILFNYFDVSHNDHLQAHAGLGDAREWYLASRADLGAWSPTTTRRPQFGIHISAIASEHQRINSGGLVG
jgi:hypothetical protein